MKTKILAVALLSIIGCALSTTNASAWGLFPRCCHRDCCVICCRPYNAFTPVCCGNMVCDGCCPFCPGGCCQPPPIQRCLPSVYNCGCGDGGCMPGPDAYAAASPMMMIPPSNMTAPPPQMPDPQAPPMPMPNGPNFTPPPPTPGPVFNQTSYGYYPQAAYGVQPVGYYPTYPVNYYPTYNYPAYNYPAYNYPTAPAMPAPYYWYNGQ